MGREGVRWELKLNLVHTVVVVGVVTGSMVAAFGFGYLSGERVGYDRALSSSLANTARYPIAGDAYGSDVSPESVSDTYAQLNQKGTERPDAAAQKNDVPELASIKRTTEAPVIEDLAAVLINDDAKKKGEKGEPKGALGMGALEGVEDSKGKEPSREKEIKEPGETLGSLAKKGEQPSAAVVQNPVERKTVKPEPVKAAATETKAAAQPAEKKPAASMPAETKTAALKPQPPAKRPVSSGWYAQIAAPAKLADADRLANQLKQSGFPAVVETAQVNGQEYYRVLAGPEKSKTMADRLVTQLSREKELRSKPFARFVP